MVSDRELLERYGAGDPSAMDALVDRHGTAVYAFVRRTLGADPAVEDLTQEVWLRVIRNWKSFDGRARFTTWLFTVTRNTCIDYLRRQKRRKPKTPPVPEDGPGFALDDVPDTAPTILDNVSRRELTGYVEEAVSELPDAQRDVFLLREHTQLTFSEIAELIGVPRDTVKSRMRYALAFVRRALRLRLRQEARTHGL